MSASPAAAPAPVACQQAPARAPVTPRRPASLLQRKCACGGETHGTGECDACRRKRERGLHRSALAPGGAGAVAPPIVREVLGRPGAPLDGSTRAMMEAGFGRDFSRVRLHADPRAAESAASVHAHAYTVGNHIVLGAGRYRPAEPRGRRLLAHELAHVVQQGDRDPGGELVVSGDSFAERAAESAGARVAAGGHASSLAAVAAPRVQREEAPPGAAPGPVVSLSWKEELVISAASALGGFSSTARRMIAALLRGVLLEVKAQIAAGKGQELLDRVLETFRSPKRVAVFVLHYWWGLIKGIFSPITGLFDLAVLVVKLQALQLRIMANAWRRRGQLVADLEQLALGYLGVKQKFYGAVGSLLASPIETVRALMAWLDKTGNDAEAAAERGGHAVGAALMAQLGKPVEELGEMAGRIVGEVLINVVLFVFTSGIGNAIAQVASKLGELGALLGRLGRIAEALGTLVAKVGEALTVVGGWITRVEHGIAEVAGALLRPLKPVLDEVGTLMGRLRTFLRNLLGVAEEEGALVAERAAQSTARQLESKAPVPEPKVEVPPVKRADVPPSKPIKGVIEGGGESTSGPAGKLKGLPGGKKTTPAAPSAPEPAADEVPRLRTGTDDAPVDAVGATVEGAGRPAGVPEPATAMAGSRTGGGRPPVAPPGQPPRLRSVQGGRGGPGGRGPRRGGRGGGANEPPEPDVNVPPEEPPVRVEPRARGYAIEDAHLPRLEGEGYERLPDWYKTHDAFRGGTEATIVEGGREIRQVTRPDLVSVKSTEIAEPAVLHAKVTADLEKMRGPYSYTKDNLRVVGAGRKRLDLVFELDVEITRDMQRTLDRLQREAGSIEFKWFVTRADGIKPGPPYLRSLGLPELD